MPCYLRQLQAVCCPVLLAGLHSQGWWLICRGLVLVYQQSALGCHFHLHQMTAACVGVAALPGPCGFFGCYQQACLAVHDGSKCRATQPCSNLACLCCLRALPGPLCAVACSARCHSGYNLPHPVHPHSRWVVCFPESIYGFLQQDVSRSDTVQHAVTYFGRSTKPKLYVCTEGTGYLSRHEAMHRL